MQSCSVTILLHHVYNHLNLVSSLHHPSIPLCSLKNFLKHVLLHHVCIIHPDLHFYTIPITHLTNFSLSFTCFLNSVITSLHTSAVYIIYTCTYVSHSTVVLCIWGWPWFGQHYSVVKEIFDDHFQFLVYGTSNKLNTYIVQKVPLVKKWVKYTPGKGLIGN